MKRVIAAFLLVSAAPAFAHVKLLDSAPAANARVKSPGLIRLHFSEPLEPALSGAALHDAGGKPVPLSSAIGAGAITLIAPVLPPGAYTVEWHGAGHDAHSVSGHFSFTVVP